jgi:fructose transport system ATP-binding protein
MPYPQANLESITAVVIGGTSLFGGRGRLVGTLIGALIVQAFAFGLSLAGVNQQWRRPRDRHPGHRRRRYRPVDPEGEVMSIPRNCHWRWTTSPTRSGTSTTQEPILSGPGLCASWGHVVGLDGVELDLYKGEVLAVIGDNGAGKSTLIKCLTGAYQPTSGQIYLEGKEGRLQASPGRPRGRHRDGLPAAGRHPRARHREQPLSRSRGAPTRPARLRPAHARQEGHGQARRGLRALELGIQTIQNMGQAVETLSGGQRQAVAVARAAAFGSKVVVLDEPTAALGVKESGMVLDMIKQLRDNGLGVILISTTCRTCGRRPTASTSSGSAAAPASSPPRRTTWVKAWRS